ncbi:MAG: hypothetical protein LBQ22_01490 [Bacteroidales bacterium]|jgi:hypothetical protein|nr:hypothetical protein [Bacteroidales bacterium]
MEKKLHNKFFKKMNLRYLPVVFILFLSSQSVSAEYIFSTTNHFNHNPGGSDHIIFTQNNKTGISDHNVVNRITIKNSTSNIKAPHILFSTLIKQELKQQNIKLILINHENV